METAQDRARRLAAEEHAAAATESENATRSRAAERQETELLDAARAAGATAAVIAAHERALAAHRRATQTHEAAERVHREAAALQREHAGPERSV